MSIESQLNDDLKAAMRAKDTARVSCIRQVRSKIQEAQNAKGFKGEVDDALYQSTIATYIKSLKKGIEELSAAGERSAELVGKYQAEIDYLQVHLPQLLDEAATRQLVDQALAELQITDPKQSGRVMGAIMKDNKGKVDPALVKKLVDAALSG